MYRQHAGAGSKGRQDAIVSPGNKNVHVVKQEMAIAIMNTGAS